MTGDSHLMRGALLGLVGGLVAAGAMSLAHRVARAIAPKAEAAPASREKDSTIKVASAIARQVGYDLTEDQEPRAARSSTMRSARRSARSMARLRRTCRE